MSIIEINEREFETFMGKFKTELTKVERVGMEEKIKAILPQVTHLHVTSGINDGFVLWPAGLPVELDTNEYIYEFYLTDEHSILMRTVDDLEDPFLNWFYILSQENKRRNKMVKAGSLVKVKTYEEFVEEFGKGGLGFDIDGRFIKNETVKEIGGITFISCPPNLYDGIGEVKGKTITPKMVKVLAKPKEWETIRAELLELREFKQNMEGLIEMMNDELNK